jgi:hypothetical protein
MLEDHSPFDLLAVTGLELSVRWERLHKRLEGNTEQPFDPEASAILDSYDKRFNRFLEQLALLAQVQA